MMPPCERETSEDWLCHFSRFVECIECTGSLSRCAMYSMRRSVLAARELDNLGRPALAAK